MRVTTWKSSYSHTFPFVHFHRPSYGGIFVSFGWLKWRLEISW